MKPYGARIDDGNPMFYDKGLLSRRTNNSNDRVKHQLKSRARRILNKQIQEQMFDELTDKENGKDND